MTTRIAILRSSFNSDICSGLYEGALRAFGDLPGIRTFEAPGAYELPLLAQELARTGEFDGILALGAVIEGDTAHFQYISSAVAHGLMQVSLASRVPIAFGVLTTYTGEQARLRSHPTSADNKGYEAAQALLLTLETLRGLRRSP